MDELLDLLHPHAYVLNHLLVLFVEQHPSPGDPYYHLFRGGEDGVEQQNLMADMEVVEGASQGGGPVDLEGAALHLQHPELSSKGGVFGEEGHVDEYSFHLLLQEFVDDESENKGGNAVDPLQLLERHLRLGIDVDEHLHKQYGPI